MLNPGPVPQFSPKKITGNYRISGASPCFIPCIHARLRVASIIPLLLYYKEEEEMNTYLQKQSQHVPPPPLRPLPEAKNKPVVKKHLQVCTSCGYETHQPKRFADHQRSCAAEGGESLVQIDSNDNTIMSEAPPFSKEPTADESRCVFEEKLKEAQRLQQCLDDIEKRQDLPVAERQSLCLTTLDQYYQCITAYCNYRASYFVYSMVK